jgi:hypothetical protein
MPGIEPPPEELGCRYLAQTMKSLLPVIQMTGLASSDEVGPGTLEDRLLREVTEAQAVMVSPALIGVWGRVGRASGRTVLLSEIGPATCLKLEMGELPGVFGPSSTTDYPGNAVTYAARRSRHSPCLPRRGWLPHLRYTGSRLRPALRPSSD